MAGLGSTLGTIAGRITQTTVAQAALAVAFFLALKIVLSTLIMTVLGVVLHNFALDFLYSLFTHVVNKVSSDIPQEGLGGVVLQLEGIGAYIGNKLMLPQCFSVYLGGLSFAFVRNFVPFLK